MVLVQSDLLFAAKQVLSSLPLSEQLSDWNPKKFRVTHGGQVVQVDIDKLVKDVITWSSAEGFQADGDVSSPLKQDQGYALMNFVDSYVTDVFIDPDMKDLRITGLSGLLMAMTETGDLFPVCINKVFIHEEPETQDQPSAEAAEEEDQPQQLEAVKPAATTTVEQLGPEKEGQAEQSEGPGEPSGPSQERSADQLSGKGQDEQLSIESEPQKESRKTTDPVSTEKKDAEETVLVIPDHVLTPLPNAFMKIEMKEGDEWTENNPGDPPEHGKRKKLTDGEKTGKSGKVKKKKRRGANMRAVFRDWSCKICSHSPGSQWAYYKHLKTHSEEELAQMRNEQTLQKTWQKAKKWDLPPAREEDGKIVCETCGKSFKAMETYRRHYKRHLGVPVKKYYYPNEPSMCQFCGKRMGKKSLRQHIRYKHSDKRGPYVCPRCHAVYNQYRTYVNHVAQHDGAQLYQCHICQKNFRSSTGYRDHMNMHNGIHPYSCNFCDQTFVHQTVWRNHVRKHTHQDEQKEVTCEHCGAILKNFRSFQGHLMRVHKMKKLGYGHAVDTDAHAIVEYVEDPELNALNEQQLKSLEDQQNVMDAHYVKALDEEPMSLLANQQHIKVLEEDGITLMQI